MKEILKSTKQEQLEAEAALEQGWNMFRHLTATDDRDAFARSFVGKYATRASFGEHLIRHTYGANERLAQLPRWLQGYLRLDGDAVAIDFERAGHYLMLDAPEDGVFVFDAAVVSAPLPTSKPVELLLSILLSRLRDILAIMRGISRRFP